MTHSDLHHLLAHETPLRAADAAKRCGVSIGALVRWIRKGKLMPDGQRRKLEGYAAGRSWMTTVEALTRFIAGEHRQPQPTKATEDPAYRRQAQEDVRRARALIAKL